ncbi:MAG: hypothetical protein EXR94_08395 [Gemmatimonadetes bacterium]|nr:hypothetical protein [Gemmatimonadota bacterium]
MHMLLLALAIGSQPNPKPRPPVLTDEFDLFLVTAATEAGAVVGRIQPVFPNDKPIRWSLIKPVPGGDPRGYLRGGQLDATTIVTIDSATGVLRLVRHPDRYPQTLYAEVRATNDDGFMEQVLIIVALAEAPRREQALDIFPKRSQVHGIRFLATAGVDPAKIGHATKVAKALLSKDLKGSGRIVAALKKQERMMTLFMTFEERNTAVGFQMFAGDYDAQDLEDEEIIPDYFRLGGPDTLRRDASVEEITHLIHGAGIVTAYPKIQQRLERATQAAIDRKFFRPWDGLPADSFSHEYLTIGLEIVYGGRQRSRYMGRIIAAGGSPQQPSFRLSLDNDRLLTAENLRRYDRELYEIVRFLFPTKEEFFAEMGWTGPPSKPD